MTTTGAYGERLGEFLRLEEVPPTLVTRTLRSTEMAVTETRNDNPVSGLSGSLAAEDAYLVSLKLRDYPECELWEQGRHIKKADVHAGTTYIYDLKTDPRYVIDKPLHSLHFYVPRSALDGLADQSGARRIDALDCRLVGHDDAIVRHIGASLREGLRRPAEANQLFIDHMLLGLTAHVAQAYGGFRQKAEISRGALAPWQLARACDKLEVGSRRQAAAAGHRGRTRAVGQPFLACVSRIDRLAALSLASASSRENRQAIDERARSVAVRGCDFVRLCQPEPLHAGLLRARRHQPGCVAARCAGNEG